MNNFQPLEVVDCGGETQPQVVENLNKLYTCIVNLVLCLCSGSVFGDQAASTTEGGGGLFFGGLGGKPSEENAGKNVFGGTQFGGGQNTQASSMSRMVAI